MLVTTYGSPASHRSGAAVSKIGTGSVFGHGAVRTTCGSETRVWPFASSTTCNVASTPNGKPSTTWLCAPASRVWVGVDPAWSP